jgi:hypothetical protein
VKGPSLMSKYAQVLESIAKCDDPQALRRWIENAREKNADEVADAAFRRLVSIVPSEEPGTVEHDFWQTIQAFEFLLSEERGRTTRLSRTRQKVTRVGVVQTLKDWALDKKQTQGFEMLMERGMPELTGEAVVLRHPDNFEADVQAAARDRLIRAGVNVNQLRTSLTN